MNVTHALLGVGIGVGLIIIYNQVTRKPDTRIINTSDNTQCNADIKAAEGFAPTEYMPTNDDSGTGLGGGPMKFMICPHNNQRIGVRSSIVPFLLLKGWKLAKEPSIWGSTQA